MKDHHSINNKNWKKLSTKLTDLLIGIMLFMFCIMPFGCEEDYGQYYTEPNPTPTSSRSTPTPNSSAPAILQSFSGDVRVNGYRPTELPVKLYAGYTIDTSSGSYATVWFPEVDVYPEVEVELMSNTGIEILNPRYKVLYGSTLTKVLRFLSKVFCVFAGFTKTCASGTEFWVSVYSNNNVFIEVYEDSVTVESTGSRYWQVSVNAGYWVSIEGDQQEPPIPMPSLPIE